MSQPYELEVRRAALPAVLFPSDIAVSLEITEEAAECLVREDRLGPHLLVGGRPAVLKDAFLGSLGGLARSGKRGGKEVLP